MINNEAYAQATTTGAPGEKLVPREILTSKAQELGKFLSGRANITKVGLIGSIVRGLENPGDIDLVIMLPNEIATRYIEDYMESAGNEQISMPNKLKYMGLDSTEQEELTRILAYERDGRVGRIPVDFIMLSDAPDIHFIRNCTISNFDPDFLGRIGREMLTYDPETERYVERAVFDTATAIRIEQTAFQVMKHMGNNPEILEIMSKHPSHIKRIKRREKDKEQ